MDTEWRPFAERIDLLEAELHQLKIVVQALVQARRTMPYLEQIMDEFEAIQDEFEAIQNAEIDDD